MLPLALPQAQWVLGEAGFDHAELIWLFAPPVLAAGCADSRRLAWQVQHFLGKCQQDTKCFRPGAAGRWHCPLNK